MSIEVMKQALEALEYLATQIKPDYEHSNAITSLRQAIAEAEKQNQCTRVECMGSKGCIDACWKNKEGK